MSTAKLLNKMDGIMQTKSPPLMDLEVCMEQFIQKESQLLEHERKIEAATEEYDLEEEVSAAMEYKNGITTRKSEAKQMLANTEATNK